MSEYVAEDGLLNIEQIRDGLLDGSIVVDFAEHRGNGEKYQRERLIQALSENVEHCYSIQKEGNKGSQEFFDFTMRLRKAGERLGMLSVEMHCFECGRNLPYILKDANTVTFGLTYEQKQNNETDNTCPMKDLGESFSFEIEVKSGKLVFTNFFDDRKIDKDGNKTEVFEPEDRYSEKYSLNSTLGRINITKHYAEKYNIAYAQMGNMSIGVFVNKAHDGIIIGDYARKRIDGHSIVGDICLSVWRWMAVDIDVLKKYDVPVPGDAIIIEVPNGTYKVTNYYGFSCCKATYSTLVKVK